MNINIYGNKKAIHFSGIGEFLFIVWNIFSKVFVISFKMKAIITNNDNPHFNMMIFCQMLVLPLCGSSGQQTAAS